MTIFLNPTRLCDYTYCSVGARGGDDILNDIGRNSLLGNRKKIAKFLMSTFTCRSTFLYAQEIKGQGFPGKREAKNRLTNLGSAVRFIVGML
jgi:hypothetical protein